jgi:hypothetical protein
MYFIPNALAWYEKKCKKVRVKFKGNFHFFSILWKEGEN